MLLQPALPEGDANIVVVYMIFRGVELPLEDDEDFQALIEGGLIKSAILLSRGELVIALQLEDQDQARTVQALLQQVIRGRVQFILTSESHDPELIRSWALPNLVICISLLLSNELDGSEIARSILADNPDVEVDVVEVIGQDRPTTGALVQVTGRRRGDLMRQLSRALTSSKATPAFWSFSLTPEEKERRRQPWREPTHPANDGVPESPDVIPSVRRIAERRGISIDEAIRASGQTLDWIDRQVSAGGRFLIVRNRKRYRINFPL
jgi:hypothetical protein